MQRQAVGAESKEQRDGHRAIDQYIVENGISRTQVRRGGAGERVRPGHAFRRDAQHRTHNIMSDKTVMPSTRLQTLAKQIDPKLKLEPDAVQVLMLRARRNLEEPSPFTRPPFLWLPIGFARCRGRFRRERRRFRVRARRTPGRQDTRSTRHPAGARKESRHEADWRRR